MLAALASLWALVSGFNFGPIILFFQTLGSSIIKNWKAWLIGLLLLSNVGAAYEWSHTNDLLSKEKAAHAADIATFKKAQADANLAAQKEKVTLQKESKANADQADANYATLLTQYRANLLRYSANQSVAGPAIDHQLSSTQGGNGPGAGSQLPSTLIISSDDAQICATNTARLQAVHEWALNPPKDPTQ